jgi:hypothetical protein
MNSNMRNNFSGAFAVTELGHGGWRLSRDEPHKLDVFLRGAEPSAARVLGCTDITNLGIEWHDETATLSFAAGDRVETLQILSAIVHEPLDHLYASLPLFPFDADASRFWRRIFRLVRIPGGRYLLKFLTRRAKR